MNVETETWYKSDEALKAELQRAGFLNGMGVSTADGTLENFRLLIKNLIGGTAKPPSSPDANCVTRSSALAALSHLGQNNGPGRLAEAHNMLVAATKS